MHVERANFHSLLAAAAARRYSTNLCCGYCHYRPLLTLRYSNACDCRTTCSVAMRASRCHFNHAIIDPNFPCVYILAATLPFAALRLHAQIPHSLRPFLIQIPHILSCTRLPTCCRYCSNCMVMMDSPACYPPNPLWKYPEVCHCRYALLLLLPLHPDSF